MEFKNKTVVITGGGGVLCGAFAKYMGSLGENVAILDLKKEATARERNGQIGGHKSGDKTLYKGE